LRHLFSSSSIHALIAQRRTQTELGQHLGRQRRAPFNTSSLRTSMLSASNWRFSAQINGHERKSRNTPSDLSKVWRDRAGMAPEFGTVCPVVVMRLTFVPVRVGKNSFVGSGHMVGSFTASVPLPSQRDGDASGGHARPLHIRGADHDHAVTQLDPPDPRVAVDDQRERRHYLFHEP
jgi:hypothetical protein